VVVDRDYKVHLAACAIAMNNCQQGSFTNYFLVVAAWNMKERMKFFNGKERRIRRSTQTIVFSGTPEEREAFYEGQIDATGLDKAKYHHSRRNSD